MLGLKIRRHVEAVVVPAGLVTAHSADQSSSAPAAQAADDKARLKLLEREVKELRRANEILRKASAYFTMAEFDRHGK